MVLSRFQRAAEYLRTRQGGPSIHDTVCHDTVRHSTVRWDRVMLCMGTLGLVYCLVAGFFMVHARSVANGFVPSSRSGAVGASLLSAASGSDEDGRPKVVGRVEIPAIGLATPLLAGDDAMSLAEGAGLIPGTALPGGLGTVGIAGHRDTHFRLLRKVTPGMEVRLVNKGGVYSYRVTSSEIVLPEQVSVLATTDFPSLVLVTCYPFRFIGHAPKRFIVHAKLVSAVPD